MDERAKEVEHGRCLENAWLLLLLGATADHTPVWRGVCRCGTTVGRMGEASAGGLG